MVTWPYQNSVPGPHRSRAPYNFVPLPERIFVPGAPIPDYGRLELDRFHGHIDLQIITETPLYTRCAHDPADGADVRHSPAKQRFFHHGDGLTPVIPGASLRGMVRSLVEVLSYSRIARRAGATGVGRLRDEKLVYRAVADQETRSGQFYNRTFVGMGPNLPFPGDRVRAGYLEDTPAGMAIRPAMQLLPVFAGGVSLPRTLVRVPTSLPGMAGLPLGPAGTPPSLGPPTEAWVQVPGAPYASAKPGGRTINYWKASAISTIAPAAAGWLHGYLVPSGTAPMRHMHTFVFERDPAAAPLAIPRNVWQQFQDDQSLTRGLPCRMVSVGEPVFYLVDGAGAVVFLGPTLFFRIPYPHGTSEFVPAATQEGGLDLAEAIFGSVNPGRRNFLNPLDAAGAHRGRVFFDDAVWDRQGGDPYLDAGGLVPRFPDILSSPKPTSYQQYLVQNPDWSAIHTDGDRKRNLGGYETTPPDRATSPRTTVIRGFKRYWHRSAQAALNSLSRTAPQPDDKQHTAIRPVKRGVRFAGRIRFENLNKMELGALFFALDIPETCRHKIGMGKPLGLGTVRILPQLRLYSPNDRYLSLGSFGWKSVAVSEATACEAKAQFVLDVVTHYKTIHPTSTLVGTAVDDVWCIRRFRELRAMLEWDQRPPDGETSYVPLPVGVGAGAGNLFKLRKVLPRASDVTPMALLDEDPVTPPQLPSPVALGTPPAPVHDDAPPIPPDKEPTALAGSELLVSVKALRQNEVAGAFGSLFSRWERLDDRGFKHAVALELVSKVDAFWKKGKTRPVYLTLKQWLDAEPQVGDS